MTQQPENPCHFQLLIHTQNKQSPAPPSLTSTSRKAHRGFENIIELISVYNQINDVDKYESDLSLMQTGLPLHSAIPSNK